MTDPECKPTGRDPTGSAEQEETAHEETGQELSRRQMLALPIIAAAPNLTQAAKDAGISEATLRRWRREEGFRAELDRLTAEIADTTRQELKSITLQGFRVIRELMQDPDPDVRLRAARAAIIVGIRVIDLEKFLKQGTTECPDHPFRETE
ncbi:MAG: hypothetical protein F4X66_03860 [Chloroflexi bacterium]|nr:hypothetical protein [Chloroflexota bacterium]MYE41821.1 hypothetical protein [Chloroflexota bacterium]